MSDNMYYLPHELQLSEGLNQISRYVCKKSEEFLKKHLVLKVDSHNPLL